MRKHFDVISVDLNKKDMEPFDWYRMGVLHDRKSLLRLVEEYETHSDAYCDCEKPFMRPEWLQEILSESE